MLSSVSNFGRIVLSILVLSNCFQEEADGVSAETEI